MNEWMSNWLALAVYLPSLVEDSGRYAGRALYLLITGDIWIDFQPLALCNISTEGAGYG